MNNLKMYFILLTLILISCSNRNSEIQDMNNQEPKANMKYPYIASKEKADLLIAGYAKLKIGMKKNVVIEILGHADEVNDTLDKNDWSKKIGYSHVYILQRLKENGSADEKKESLIRVMFNLNDEVVSLDKWKPEIP